jgi:uncharacterized UPF0146 family protein
MVTLSGSGSDPDGEPVSFEWKDENNNIVGVTPVMNITVPLGTHTFTLKVTDAVGLSAAATTRITVGDTTPPTSTVSLSPNVLWPPNHKLVGITTTPQVSDTCDPNPTVALGSIESNEPLDPGGIQAVGGGPVPFGTDVRSFQLRAERLGRGNGRVYTVRPPQELREARLERSGSFTAKPLVSPTG